MVTYCREPPLQDTFCVPVVNKVAKFFNIAFVQASLRAHARNPLNILSTNATRATS